MPSHVFISYSDKDKTFAEMLLGALEHRGTKCWIAPRDIPPGGSYADAIMRAIEECECFVLVYTGHSNTSPHVLREVERALKFERNIIPVRFDQSEPSRSLDYLLATVHWLSIDISTTSISVSRVAERISSCIPAAATKPSSTIEVPALPGVDRASAKKSNLPKFIAVGLIAAASVGAAILLTQFFMKKSQPKGFEATASPSPAVTPAPTVAPPPVIAQASPSAPVETPSPISQAPSVTVPEPTTVEQPTEKSETGSPQSVLRRYFNCFAERDPSAAYQLFSNGFRSAMSFKKYSALFSSTREMKVGEINLTSRTQNNATAFVRFEEVDADYHSTYWEGPIELVREGNEWRIKTLRDLKKVAMPNGDAVTKPKSGSAAPTPRPPEKAWSKPHIYLELANESQRTAALDLKRRLTQLGCDVVEIERASGNVDIPSATSELRYFSTMDAAEADRLANQMRGFFGNTGIIASLPEGMPYVSHSRQYEIWFSSAFH